MLKIIRGWLNRFRRLSPELKELFDERLVICHSNECGMLKFGICTACGCPVKTKTKVLSECCPENMWAPTVHEDNGESFILLSEVPNWLEIAFRNYRRSNYYPNLPFGGVLLEDWTEFLENYEASNSSSASFRAYSD